MIRIHIASRLGLLALAATVALWAVPARLHADPLIDRSAYDALLNAYIRNGGVNYAGLSKDRGNLEAFVQSLAEVSSETLRRAPAEEQLAFWINAYNAVILSTVVEKFPPPTGENADPPGEREETVRVIAGETISLKQVKHQKLIEKLKEPRVHFALSTASLGGPALRARAYDKQTIEESLEEAARAYVNAPRHVRVDTTSATVYLSQVFQWFGDDFVEKYAATERLAKKHGPELGACLNFVALYLPPETQVFVRQNDIEVRFIEYDWGLNKAPPIVKEPKPPSETPTPAQPTATPANTPEKAKTKAEA